MTGRDSIDSSSSSVVVGPSFGSFVRDGKVKRGVWSSFVILEEKEERGDHPKYGAYDH
jgi:thiamine phosphate synthase YjbQ (UPF0047 family)